MLRTRGISWALILALCALGAWSCTSTTSQTVDREKSFWSKPSPMSLYRGLKSGLSPQQAREEICRRWSFGGKCAALEPLDHKTYFRLMGKSRMPTGLKLFRYREQDGAFPCDYFLFFQDRGLSQIRSRCIPTEKAQLSAHVRRYRRLYGKPLVVFSRRRGRVKARVWEDKAPKRQVMLLVVRDRILVGVHRDMRLLWTRYVERLRPELSNSQVTLWRIWQKMPTPVRQEVLEHFSRMLVRLERLIADRPLARLPTTAWGPKKTAPACQPVALEHWRHAFGRDKTWRKLKFVPTRPMRLQYQWHTRGGSIYSRTFTIKARGCGYRFRLIIDQNGRKMSFRRLRFSMVGGPKKKPAARGVVGGKR